MKILVLHGVNLNMFGKRDPAFYGTATLDDINSALVELGKELRVEVETFQTNHEGEMVERIHAAHSENVDGIVINAGAWTHYSYALADALAILSIPVAEAHMSFIFNREDFRRKSVLSPAVSGCVAGFGVDSYLLALRAVVSLAKNKTSKAS